jgi:hypothetical protein
LGFCFSLSICQFEDYKKEVFETIDSNVLDIADAIKRVEELRVKALLAKKSGDEKQEKWYLDNPR